MNRALTRDGVLVTVTLTDANQKGSIFVLGSQQQLLSFRAVDVAIVPPAERGDENEETMWRFMVSEQNSYKEQNSGQVFDTKRERQTAYKG